MNSTFRALQGLLCAMVFWVVPVWGLDALVVELDGIQAKDWSTGPLLLRIEPLSTKAIEFKLDARQLQFPSPLNNLKRIQVHCAEGRWLGGHISCPRAVITPYLGSRKGPPLILTFDYVQETGRLHLSGRKMAIAQGRLDLDLDFDRTGGHGSLNGRDLNLPQLVVFATGLNPDLPRADFQVSAGFLNLQAKFDFTMANTDLGGRVTAKLGLRGVDFSDSQGLHAGEGVGLALTVQANSLPGIWKFNIETTLRTGTMYLDPLLLEVGSGGLEATAQGRWQPGRSVDVAHFSLRQPQVLQLHGSGRWLETPSAQLETLNLVIPPTPLAPIYTHYLKAFAGAGALADLAIEGDFGLSLDWRRQGDSTLEVKLKKLAMGDASGLFALLGLDGDLHWRSGVAGPVSHLTWDGAQMYRLDLGAGGLDLTLHDRLIELHRPLRLELLSGELEISQLQASDVGLDTLSLEMAATLDGIDLGELGNTLAWVPMAGQLSGQIPSVQYNNGRIQVAGTINLSLFDGSATVSKLSLEDPFGLVPRLGMDIDLQNLSLDLLSRSFSFGAIAGRLDGSIHNLVLDGWQPVSFDARLQTPPGDTSRHRISQRAVDNLASLGGANAVLSSTFLRFFNDFSYQRLGISCRLLVGVCEMDGVAPADTGYYIVQGGGIPPRVDVVGYNRRVNWRTLLGRLRAINQLDEVVVQ